MVIKHILLLSIRIYYNYGMTDKGKIALRTAEVETLNIRIAV